MAKNGYAVITSKNLKTYMKWQKKPWSVDGMLYERLPMLAVRNYLSEEDNSDWPLCWTNGRPVRLGLAACIEALKSWQAFRSPQTDVVSKTRQELEACVPRIVDSMQRWLREREIYRLKDATGEARKQLIQLMANAVAKVSACKRLKKSNPMLGSKVMHFFFPEFFPVWDTAWIKKVLRGLERKKGIAINSHWKLRGPHADAAIAYAQYVQLMLDDVGFVNGNVRKLKHKIVSSIAKEYKHRRLETVVDDNLDDLTPIVFEICLLGYGRAAGVLK